MTVLTIGTALLAVVWVLFVKPSLPESLPHAPGWRDVRRLQRAVRGLCGLLVVSIAWETHLLWVSGFAVAQAVTVAGFMVLLALSWPPRSIALRITELRARAEAVEDRAEWSR